MIKLRNYSSFSSLLFDTCMNYLNELNVSSNHIFGIHQKNYPISDLVLIWSSVSWKKHCSFFLLSFIFTPLQIVQVYFAYFKTSQYARWEITVLWVNHLIIWLGLSANSKTWLVWNVVPNEAKNSNEYIKTKCS